MRPGGGIRSASRFSPLQRRLDDLWFRFVEELRRGAELERAKALHYRRAFVEDRAYFDRYCAKLHQPPTFLSREERGWAKARILRTIEEHLDGVLGCACLHAGAMHGRPTSDGWSSKCRALGCACDCFVSRRAAVGEVRRLALGLDRSSS